MEDSYVESTLKNTPCARSHVLLSKTFLAGISASFHMARNPGTEQEELRASELLLWGVHPPWHRIKARSGGPPVAPQAFMCFAPLSHSKLPCLRFENRTLHYGMRQHFLSSPQAHQHTEEWKGRCVSFQGGSSERPVFVSLSFVKLKGVRSPPPPPDCVSVCCPL